MFYTLHPFITGCSNHIFLSILSALVGNYLPNLFSLVLYPDIFLYFTFCPLTRLPLRKSVEFQLVSGILNTSLTHLTIEELVVSCPLCFSYICIVLHSIPIKFYTSAIKYSIFSTLWLIQ